MAICVWLLLQCRPCHNHLEVYKMQHMGAGICSSSLHVAVTTPAPQMRLADFTFENGLNNHDRAVVHAECKKLGFTSKSHG